MDLTERIREQIRTSLPALTADELLATLAEGKAAVSKANALEDEAAGLRGQVGDLENKVAELKTRTVAETCLKAEREALDKIQVKAKETDVSLKHREAMLELREKHAAEKVSFAREIVLAVFANNRMKYRESGYIPVPVEGSQGYSGGVVQSPVTKDIETEG